MENVTRRACILFLVLPLVLLAFAPLASWGSDGAAPTAPPRPGDVVAGSAPANAAGEVSREEAPPVAFADSRSVEAIAVFAGESIQYSLYGHESPEPTRAHPPRNWSWWALEGGTAGAVSTSATMHNFSRPDAAFSRTGRAMVVWDEAVEEEILCNGDNHPRVQGDIMARILTLDPLGGSMWGPVDVVHRGSPDHLLSNPSVALDSDGRGLVVWVHTRVARDAANCVEGLEKRLEYKHWDGSAWSALRVIDDFRPTICVPTNAPTLGHELLLSGVASPCDHTPDFTFVASRTSHMASETVQEGVVIWEDYHGVATYFCSGNEFELPVFWPRYVTWDGLTVSAPASVAPGPLLGPENFTSMPLPFLTNLGVTPDQRGNAVAAFPVQRETVLPNCGTNGSPEIWTSNWNGSSASWSETAPLPPPGWAPSAMWGASVAYHATPEMSPNQPDDSAVVVYDLGHATRPPGEAWRDGGLLGGTADHRFPSVTALAHDRLLVVWEDLFGTDTPIAWAEMNTTSGEWSPAATLVPGAMPRVASLTGSPGLPRAEWTYIGYFAADNDLHPFIAADDRNEVRQANATALVNVALFVDALRAWDAAAWGPYRLGPPAPPGPFPDGNARFEYITESGVVQRRNAGEVHSGDPGTLRDVLAWGIEHYPADRFILDLADHGGGWQEVCVDHSHGDAAIDMPELTSALAQSRVLPEFRWNILTFSACLMAQIEVAYEVEPFARYLVASEELMPGAGPPYKAILDDLVASPFRTDEGASSAFVAAYRTAYTGGAGVDSLETLSAIDLSAVPSVVQNVSAFAAALVDWLTDPSAPAAERAARLATLHVQRNASAEFPHALYQASGYNSEGYRDLSHFASLVAASVSPDDPGTALDDAVRATAQALLPAMAAATVDNFADAGHPNARGLSIYLEPLSAVFATHRAAYAATRFGTEVGDWVDFVTSQAGSRNIVLHLSSPSPYLRLQVHAEAGDVGLPLFGDLRCSSACGSTLEGARCIERRNPGTTIVLPETVPGAAWTVNGSLLAESAEFRLVIQAVVDGAVVDERVVSRLLSPGEVVSEEIEVAFPPPRGPLLGDLAPWLVGVAIAASVAATAALAWRWRKRRKQRGLPPPPPE